MLEKSKLKILDHRGDKPRGAFMIVQPCMCYRVFHIRHPIVFFASLQNKAGIFMVGHCKGKYQNINQFEPSFFPSSIDPTTTMSSFQALRASISHSANLRTSTRSLRQISFSQTRFSHQGYGQSTSGEEYTKEPSPENKSSSDSKHEVRGKQPKILSENPPSYPEQTDDVKKHNEELENRPERAEMSASNEEAEKDKVSPEFWSGKSCCYFHCTI
jgi:hypothetical protein